MTKKAAVEISATFLACTECSKVTAIMTSKNKGLDGFIKHGCAHSALFAAGSFLPKKAEPETIQAMLRYWRVLVKYGAGPMTTPAGDVPPLTKTQLAKFKPRKGGKLVEKSAG